MDSTQKTTQPNILPLLGLGLVVLLTSQCITPLANPISRAIASHSVYVMLGFFIIGGIAFLAKKPFMMLYTWLACVALCHFLKDTQHSPFYYAKAREEARQIQIAHFDIGNETEKDIVLGLISGLKADLISVQSSGIAELGLALSAKLKESHPFMLVHCSESKENTFVFSKMRLEASDTFHCGKISYLTSNLIIDSASQRKLQFLSFYLANNVSENPEFMMESLSKIGTCWSARQAKGLPLMAFAAIPSVAWSPEIRAFRTLCTLNDSRLDLELQPNPEHIFYSNHLRCLHFESLPSGIGVIGTYQLKIPAETAEMHTRDFNPMLTQR